MKPRQTSNSERRDVIVDAVHDQHGGVWVRIDAPRRNVWICAADLAASPSTVFRDLTASGVMMVAPAAQSALRREIQGCEARRAALVAMRPGWIEGFYVHADGCISRPASDDREVIVTFEHDRRFVPSGTLKDWQAKVGPFIADQPLPYLAIALALTGPLLRFAPPGYINPMAEVVGPPEMGKTILGVLAGSVWSGNPESDVGGGELWDLTSNAIDDVKLSRRDGFVYFDEGNLAASTARERREFAQHVVFKLAATGVKRRMGDQAVGEHARFSFLSSTNTPIADLLDPSGDSANAARSRLISISLAGSPFGIFAAIPTGYADARAAGEALRQALDSAWGGAARAFVSELVSAAKHDEAGFKSLIQDALNRVQNSDLGRSGSARIQKTFALMTVAADLAWCWGIIPRSWGIPQKMLAQAARLADETVLSRQNAPIESVQAYVDRHKSSLIDVATLDQPLSIDAFKEATGFVRATPQGRELLVPANRFQSEIPDHQAVMSALRQLGLARTEGGRHKKLSIKAPRAICTDGRVYCISLQETEGRAADTTSQNKRSRVSIILWSCLWLNRELKTLRFPR